jgi:outer membrane translocation and assembly module TamA
VGRIKKVFREDGYLRVDVPVSRTIHDDTKTIDLAVTINPGPRFVMGKLTIKGLDILNEPYIRKLWKLNEGESYKEAYPDQFLAMLQAEDYFDNLARTGAEADIHEDTHTVDVTLTFVGGKLVPDNQRGRRR